MVVQSPSLRVRVRETDRAGSPLIGRVSHRLDDARNFIESSHSRLLSDQPCLVASMRQSLVKLPRPAPGNARRGAGPLLLGRALCARRLYAEPVRNES